MTFVIDFILIIGIIVAILILLSLLNSKDKGISKRLLIIFFTLTLLVNISAYSSLHDFTFLYAFTFLFDFSIVWLIGPLLLLYIRSLFEDNRLILKRYAIHFIPVVILILVVALPLVMSFLFDEFSPKYLEYLDENQSSIIILRDLYCIAYLVFSLRIFKGYREKMKCNYSTLSESDFGWIQKLLTLCLTFISLDFLMNVYELMISPLPFHSGFLIIFFIIAFTIYLGFYGIKQSEILLPDFLALKSANAEIEPVKPNEFTPNEKMKSLKIQFQSQLESKKYYLEEDLTLTKLADYYGMPDKVVSELLNRYIGLSFYDYINSLRIEAVKKKLVDPKYEAYTIVALALESGFNSKATFNRIFKKETNMTPSEYRKGKNRKKL